MLLEIHEKENICEIFRPIEIVIFFGNQIYYLFICVFPPIFICLENLFTDSFFYVRILKLMGIYFQVCYIM